LQDVHLHVAVIEERFATARFQLVGEMGTNLFGDGQQ